MKKIRLASISAAMLLALAVSDTVRADATVNITGAVSSASCTIVLDPTVVNLGTHLPTNFPPSPLEGVTASSTNFTIRLQACEGTLEDATELFVAVAGNTLGGLNQLFIQSGASGNVGVILQDASANPIVNNQQLSLGSTAAGGTLPSSAITITTMLARSNTETATLGSINVPITFNFLAP